MTMDRGGREQPSRDAAPGVPVRLWAVLTEASAAASVAALPYLLALQADALAAANARRAAEGKRPLAPLTLGALTALQAQVTFGAAAALGLRAARGMGLGAPYLEAWLAGRGGRPPGGEVATAAAAGAGVALALIALERTLFRGLSERFAAAGVRQPGAWRGLLATPYGAIAEEVLLRLGLQTLLAAGLRRLRGETVRPPTAATMGPAIALAALAFGAGHLPATARLVPLTPPVVLRALALNGVAGGVYGWLYWKRGLEAAMLAHGATDLLLHVGGPLARGRDR